ncbi:MAG: glycosyl transferase [Flavobacteriaceae bacterium]|nr:glycosyl transferase [Flavobacteriaceae bacterium]
MTKHKHAAFTICSNNYLGQALALKRSLLKHNPEMSLFIILVDKLSDQVDYSIFEPAEILPIADISSIDLEDLIARYYIIELNTAVKPSVFKFLKSTYPQIDVLYYLDPDLYFYSSLSETNDILKNKTAVLTPHVLSPIPRDGHQPEENTFLRFGVYNLGFLGLRMNSDITTKLLDWWEERVIHFGYDRPNEGYFVDQLWMAHAPLFFENVVVLHTYSYNMAPWNLHERHVTSVDGENVSLNDGSQLVFYHFSKLSDDKNAISREYDRYVLDDFPLLKAMYTEYKEILKTCNYSEYKQIPIAYPVKLNLKPEPKQYSLFGKLLRKIGWRMIRWSEN